MKNQLTSLELSKELDSLGVKVESAFSYLAYYGKWECIYVECEENDWRYADEKIPAYSVAELGEMLPEMTISTFKDKQWVVLEQQKGITETSDYTEANARAKMLIYLIKNNLLDVTKLKV